MSLPPIYPPDAVKPFRDELTAVGFEQLETPEQVDEAVRTTKGTLLCFINSVCGCAAGSARPGVGMALQHRVIPDRLVTVFAGMEREAVDRVRELHAAAAPPSSPSMVLFQDGKLAAMLPRGPLAAGDRGGAGRRVRQVLQARGAVDPAGRVREAGPHQDVRIADSPDERLARSWTAWPEIRSR